MDSFTIRLRAHHALCLLGFKGKGYSPTFIEKMKHISGFYPGSLTTVIQLVDSPDDACIACPHVNLEKNICAADNHAETRMRQRDKATLKKISATHGALFSSGDLQNLVKKNFSAKTDLEQTCFACEWQSDCDFFQSRP